MTFVLWPAVSEADCEDVPDQPLEIAVKACRRLDPREAKRKGAEFRDRVTPDFWERYYRGALVTDQQGLMYVYPTADEQPCRHFPTGATVTKVVGSTCCDTGRWGKCLYGGNWLWDVGGQPINTFQ